MRTLIVSDLHLGNGGEYDIFSGGTGLAELVDSFDGSLRVILNGDALDFLLDDGPLSLEHAEPRARAIAASEDGRALFEALGRVLAGGGEVIVRPGNHDLEIALPPVQAVLREALVQPTAVAGRAVFDVTVEPLFVDVAGVRVAVTHGEHVDGFNRFDYDALLSDGDRPFAYPPGSLLVKDILNPLKARGLKFLDLLKPDFHGAVLAALAVDPSSVRAVMKRQSLTLLWRLVTNRLAGAAFAPEDADNPLIGLEERLERVELDEEELSALATALHPDLEDFGAGEAFSAALRKLGRAGFEVYARAHRRLAASAGAAFFDIEPDEVEWQEARRISALFEAPVVITGHSHSRRFRHQDGVIYVNTGTWIWLMALPAPDASPAEWADYLQRLRDDPGLEQPGWLTSRPSACLVAPADDGVDVSLIEWADGQRTVETSRCLLT